MSQLVDAEIKSAPANDLNNQNVGAGESQQPSAKAKTEAKTETSHLWRDILGMPASTPEEMQKKATLGEKPITTEAKVSQEALDIAKRTLLRIALRPESFNLIETTDSDLQALGQALGIESFWPKDQQQGQNNSSFLPWDNLTPEQKTKVLQEIEKRANKLFEDNPERAILIGLRSFDIIRGKIAQGIGFQELLPTTSQEELTPEEKKELQQLQNVPEIRDLIEGFGFNNCFRIAKNSDGTSDIVFDTDIFSKMTYEEYKLAYSGAKGKPIYSHLIKKRGWWIFEFGERSLNQEEFEEFKRKVLRKAEILHKKNDPKETTIAIYKLTQKTGNNIDWGFINQYLYLSGEEVLFSSDPKKADERNFALRVINNLIDDYLLVYNEVASVTGKPSITREQVLN
ncbi:MAG: hypothetical protein N2593_03015, partial [Patescibacteria group bacterium]|nr:hypothetical protein [Patescibacteria group bacterium]